MHFSKKRFAVSLWLAAAALCATLDSLRAEDGVFRLPQDRDAVFRKPDVMGMETDYIQFT
jgi:hypothetical protein